MNTLHMISSRRGLATSLRAAKTGDTLLLMGDAVHVRHINKTFTVYALKADVNQRGIKTADFIREISDLNWVNLTVQFTNTINWG